MTLLVIYQRNHGNISRAHLVVHRLGGHQPLLLVVCCSCDLSHLYSRSVKLALEIVEGGKLFPCHKIIRRRNISMSSDELISGEEFFPCHQDIEPSSHSQERADPRRTSPRGWRRGCRCRRRSSPCSRRHCRRTRRLHSSPSCEPARSGFLLRGSGCCS